MDYKLGFTLLVVLMLTNDGHCLRLGAFNIQIFGVSKMDKPEVVDVLIDTVARYDIVLIQEIRDSSGKAILEFLDKVNMKFPDNPFKMSLSPRLGRTTSKEQYAFFYREKAGVTVKETYVYNDTANNIEAETYDIFEREPYIVLFESSETVIKRFALIGIHVAPSEAVKELQALEVVFAQTKLRLNVEDVMVLGDLNADCSYVPKKDWENIPIKNKPAYTWWIGDEVDTTVGNTNCAYDRFISTGDHFKSAVKNGTATIFKYDELHNLNQTMALKVSDHYPIEMVLESGGTSGSTAHVYVNCYFGLVVCALLSILFTI